MREFSDRTGRRWRATALERPGPDFKGKWYLVFQPVEGGTDGLVELQDVRWNSRKTAERTLVTMSESELQRRLGWGLSRTERSVTAP